MHSSYLQGNSEGVVLHFEHFDIFNYIPARTANIFKLRNGVSRVTVPIQQGQLDGKDLLAEEPDWGPAKNLRQALELSLPQKDMFLKFLNAVFSIFCTSPRLVLLLSLA